MTFTNNLSCMRIALAIGLITGCSHDDPPNRTAKGVSEPVAPFHEDMVDIHGGRFDALGLRCRRGEPPDLATASRDYQLTEHDGQPFSIDRKLTTCDDYDACVVQHRCKASEDRCIGFARMPMADAKQFCAWRGARLPSYLEWQRAAIGVRGDEVDTAIRPCEPDDRAPSDQQLAMHCRLVSEVGLEFSLSGGFGGEWTRDTDCYANHGVIEVNTVGIDTHEQGWPQGRILGGTDPIMRSGVFRCVHDTVSLE